MPVINAKDYKITVGPQALQAISSFLAKHHYSAYVILCDENTLQHCLPTLIMHCPELGQAQIIETESGETAKSLEVCAHIWQTLLENKADKNTLLINLGGGVISDLGGFTASVYKRGLDFIHIPTSLLAMADASVGGKTGVDFYGIKNSIGTFTQPKAVFVNPDFLAMLPPRQYQSGLAEIFKLALVADKSFWTELAANKKPLAAIIAKSIAIKNTIVLRDPFDKGLRKTLNFGHSIGHAIESRLLGTEDELLHGEAILTGMLMESHIAFQKKLIGKSTLHEISGLLQSVFNAQPLPQLSIDDILELLGNDKKTTGTRLQFALIDGIGSCRVDVAVTPEQVKKAFVYYSTLTV